MMLHVLLKVWLWLAAGGLNTHRALSTTTTTTIVTLQGDRLQSATHGQWAHEVQHRSSRFDEKHCTLLFQTNPTELQSVNMKSFYGFKLIIRLQSFVFATNFISHTMGRKKTVQPNENAPGCMV
jgi:hypothetical protein